VAFHIELHAIAATAFAEIVDEPPILQAAVVLNSERPYFAIAADLLMAVYHVKRLGVGRDRDTVGPIDVLLRQHARHLAVGINAIDSFDTHLQFTRIAAVAR